MKACIRTLTKLPKCTRTQKNDIVWRREGGTTGPGNLQVDSEVPANSVQTSTVINATPSEDPILLTSYIV